MQSEGGVDRIIARLLGVILGTRGTPELRRVLVHVQRVVGDLVSPVNQDRRHIVIEELLVLIVADDDQRIEFGVDEFARQLRDILGAARRTLFQNLGFDLLLDRRIGLFQQFAISAGLAVLVDQLAARGVDRGVLGIVLGRTVQQR